MPHGPISTAGKDKQPTVKYFNYVLAHVCMRKSEACAWHLTVSSVRKSEYVWSCLCASTGAPQTKEQRANNVSCLLSITRAEHASACILPNHTCCCLGAHLVLRQDRGVSGVFADTPNFPIPLLEFKDMGVRAGFNPSHLLPRDYPPPLQKKNQTNQNTTTQPVSVCVWYSHANPGVYTAPKA